VTSEDHGSDQSSGGGDRLAYAISVLLSPLVLPAVVAVILLFGLDAHPLEISMTALVVAAAMLVFPLLDILWQIRRGNTNSLDVPNREARTEIFVVAILGVSAAVFSMRALSLTGQPVIHALLIAYLLNLVLIMGINLFWKISVHMVGMGGAVAIFWLASGLSQNSTPMLSLVLSVAFLCLVPVVGWARLRLRAHTLSQVVAGALVGFIGHWLAFSAQQIPG
jgi:membrane-associated phospholipid phosphatase